MYDVGVEAARDIPGLDGAERAELRERGAAFEIERPSRDPELCFIAVADGRVVGFASLDVFPDDVFHGLTAVAREWRGRGVGAALKRSQIEAAKSARVPAAPDREPARERADAAAEREARVPPGAEHVHHRPARPAGRGLNVTQPARTRFPRVRIFSLGSQWGGGWWPRRRLCPRAGLSGAGGLRRRAARSSAGCCRESALRPIRGRRAMFRCRSLRSARRRSGRRAGHRPRLAGETSCGTSASDWRARSQSSCR